MVEIDSTLGDGIVAIRHHGAMTNREFTELARGIARLSPQTSWLFLFDWHRIETWPFVNPDAEVMTAWCKAARAIRRTALVHDHRMNRQAAWLGAVLRERGVLVRSWRPPEAAVALRWLRADLPENSSDSTTRPTS